MSQVSYAVREWRLRWRRYVAQAFLLALSVSAVGGSLLFSGALQRALQAPLADFHSSLTVQRSGNLPEEMSGPILPCAMDRLTAEEAQAVAAIPGVRSLEPGLLFWDFEPENFRIVV